jgi:hypothetical protein
VAFLLRAGRQRVGDMLRVRHVLQRPPPLPPLPTSQSRRLLLMPKLQFRALGMGLCF